VTDVLGILGGCMVSATRLEIDPAIYMSDVLDSLSSRIWFLGVPKDLFTGLVKAFVFGVIIAGVGCAAGLRASQGAIGVGRATRSSVITSFLLIIIVGYFMTSLFYS
jgi:phospholipid/cholesterol/gamma-HCH transport system permease protein